MAARSMFPVVALAVLGACSAADDGDWPDVESDRAELRGAMALEVELQAALLRDPKMSVASGLVVPATVRAMLENWDAYVGRACIALAATVDADRDGIPAAGRMTVNCMQGATPGSTQATHVTGVVRLFDLNDRLPNDGYRLRFENLEIAHGVPGGMPVTTSTLNGDIFVVVGGSPPSMTKGMKLTEDMRWKYSDVAADGSIWWSSYAINLVGTYMPEPNPYRSDPFALGVLDFEGQSLATSGMRSWIKAYWTEPPLHWNRKCELTYADAWGFDRGVVNYKDADGVQRRMVFEGCI